MNEKIRRMSYKIINKTKFAFKKSRSKLLAFQDAKQQINRLIG